MPISHTTQRRQHARGCGVSLLFCILLSACRLGAQAPTAPAPSAAARPNIILILADDMDLLLLAYMPQLRALVSDQDASFTQFFVNDPACCPSRASILRGQYAHNTGVFANEGPLGGFKTFARRGLEASTLATWLQEAGYTTMLIGKYLNGYPAPDQPIFSISPPSPRTRQRPRRSATSTSTPT